ncbi:MAG: general secretion pathway protein GspB [Gammaproteobacteria bacterium]|nr:general secretion pathway protein GspB [Gammaproteobacteria bacterium]
MSYILDALTKSQRERRRHGLPTLGTDHAPTPAPAGRRMPRTMRMTALSVSAAAIAMVAVYALTRDLAPDDARQAAAAAPARGSAPETVALAPAAPAHETPQRSTEPTRPLRRAAVPMDARGADTGVTRAPARATQSARTTPVAAKQPADEPQSSSVTTAIDAGTASSPRRAMSPEMRRLEQEILALKREAETAAQPDQAQAPSAASAASEAPPANTRAASVATAGARADVTLGAARLSPATRASLPPLNVNAHAYAQAPEQRMIIVNMKRYREGDRMREGPVVETITPKGAVLLYQQRRFELPAR